MDLVLLLVAVAIGAFMPIQAGVNSLLRGHLSSPLTAAFISFFVGTVALLVACLIQRAPWPSLQVLGKLPAWLWTGGVLGASFVAGTIVLAPRIGAVAMTSFILVGQLLASLLLDHHGLLGYPMHGLNGWRILGVVLLAAGAWLIRVF
jgi:transporter family-2 protein